jgi:hypothetical protein
MAMRPAKSTANTTSSQPLYVPPPRLLHGLTTRGTGPSGEALVSLSAEVFTKLLEAALASSFDEDDYLDRNADVRAGVASGAIPSALRHYAAHGFFEGRAAPSYPVDSNWYIATYPDVERAIATGQVRDAAHHFQSFGYAEGRVPNQALQQIVGEWQALAAEAKKPADGDTATPAST